MTCTITDKLVTLGSDGNTRPMPRGIVYAQPSALPVYLNNQLLSNPTPTTQTDSNGNWTLVLPWATETTPAALTWQIVLPDGTVYQGTVPAAQAGPFTIYQLVNSYSWTLQSGGASVASTAATASSLGTVQLDQNPSSGNPIAVTRNAGIVTIPTTPPLTLNYGILNLGSGPFDGVSANKFVGQNSSGTILAINGNGSNAYIFDAQTVGFSALAINSSGVVKLNLGAGYTQAFGILYATVTPTAGSPTLAVGESGAFAGGGTPNFQGTSFIGVNTTTLNTTRNLIDLQNQGTSKFAIDATGELYIVVPATTTAPGAGGAGALPATPAGYMSIYVNSILRKIPYY